MMGSAMFELYSNNYSGYTRPSLRTHHTIATTGESYQRSKVIDMFAKMREPAKETVNTTTTTINNNNPNQSGHGLQASVCAAGRAPELETVLTYSNQYEVMYIGSIRISQKRAHPTIIDDAIDKFTELKRLKSDECLNIAENNNETNCLKWRHGSSSSLSSLSGLPNIPDSNEINDSDSDSVRDNSVKDAKVSNDVTDDDYKPIGSSRRFLVKVIEENSDKLTTVCSVDAPYVQNTSDSTTIANNLMLPTTLIPNTQSLDADSRISLLKDLHDYQKRSSCSFDSPDAVFGDLNARKRSVSGDIETTQRQLSLPMGRSRLGSGGSVDLTKPKGAKYKNKTMLFLIGKLELCLISTDKHKIVLNKTFSNISHCSQGVRNADHFGVICREPAVSTPESYVIHVFRCQTEKLVREIMHSLKQAFSNAYQISKNRSQNMCEKCPMHWFRRICRDIEGQPPEKVQAVILNRMESLSERERDELMTKCQTLRANSIQQKNEFFLLALKHICESSQKKHSHIYEKSYLEKRLSSASLDTFKEKAKSSISNTFESLFKHKQLLIVQSREVFVRRQRRNTMDLSLINKSRINRTESSESIGHTPNASQLSSSAEEPFEEPQPRARSNTLSGINDLVKDNNEKNVTRSESLAVHQNQPSKKPLLNIFMKVGSQTRVTTNVDDSQQNSCRTGSNDTSNHSSGSWRQAIYNRIHVNTSKEAKSINGGTNGHSIELNDLPKRKTKQEIRLLWKRAIKQQIVLNKMERQNKMLQDDQNATSDKRMKLDYEEVPKFCDATQLWDATKTWDELLLHNQRSSHQFPYNQLTNAVALGVPRHKRGDTWIFLAQQHTMSCNDPCDNAYADTPYRELLGQLTTQQHAILVDLGRTFPKVAYYAQALGSGQLSLYNLLKAYSLYDTEVEYCQGLSFVAGILLLHMSEDDSFEMMKYILYHRGLRKQYKPDMDALQMQLYQLTRLLYDNNYQIYDHFEKHDISATLYAAPWFLTLFASQFSLSFVSRLFDILFLIGIEAIFRMALALLNANSVELLQCQSFESLMEYIKYNLPSLDSSQMEQVFSSVLAMDIKKQLDAYEVEYRVIKEELPLTKHNNCSKSSVKKSDTEKQLATDNKELHFQNLELTSQIHVHQSTINQLQSHCDNYLSTIKRLESRVRALEDERDALMHSVNALQRRNERLDNALNCAESSKNDDGSAKAARNSLGNTPVFSISCPKSDSVENGDEEVEVVSDEDDDDIDINDDDDDDDGSKEDKLYNNRTQSDASNLSI